MNLEKFPNPAGFANISAIGPVLQPFFLEKMVFPQLEKRMPELEYACWKDWLLKPTPDIWTDGEDKTSVY